MDRYQVRSAKAIDCYLPSIDDGVKWITYDEVNPPIFPGSVSVRVRVKADPVSQVPSGKTKFVSFVENVAMYIRINDASNTFEKAYISSAMEYSSNDGETWTTYNEANPPQFLETLRSFFAKVQTIFFQQDQPKVLHSHLMFMS